METKNKTEKAVGEIKQELGGTKTAKATPTKKQANQMIVAIQIRSIIRANGPLRTAMDVLGLRRKNSCILLKDDASTRGALKKLQSYLTYGEIDPETLKMLEEKRGEKGKDGKLKKWFRLHPPRGGYERKGIKKPYSLGGALGYRGEKINELLKRMI